MYFSLGTKDEGVAKLRGDAYTYMAIAALKDYFARHPDAEFATEFRDITNNHTTQSIEMIRLRPDAHHPLTLTAEALHDALLGDTAPPQDGSLISVMYKHLKEYVSSFSIPSEETLAQEMKIALETGTGQTTSPLGQALRAGAEQFLKSHPHYRVWKDRSGAVLGLEVHRAMHIDSEFLREQILSPVIAKYARGVAWRIDTRPLLTEGRQGAQMVTLKALKNPFSPESGPLEAPWNEEINLEAELPQQAQAFINKVHCHFYSDPQTGRLRPESYFNEPGAGLMESLKAGLALKGIGIHKGSAMQRTLVQLQREARKSQTQVGG